MGSFSPWDVHRAKRKDGIYAGWRIISMSRHHMQSDSD